MLNTPTIAISDDFFTAFARLPAAVRRKVQNFMDKFRSQAASNGINYEKIRDAASPEYRSARIDDNYRVIICHPNSGNVYLLLWADAHEEAYRWARQHVCRINPNTGSLQVYRTIEATPEPKVVPPAKPVPPASPELFAGFTDKELLSVGVPDECLSAVRQCGTRDGLEAIRAHLPLEAFECLVWLADGEPISNVLEAYGNDKKTDDWRESLANTASRRNFRVVETDADMMRIVDASLERWRVFLHPLQQSLVVRAAETPMLVRGAAGTGKTVVAMHRAAHLVSRPDWGADDRLLFTTFTKNLAVDIGSQLDLLCTPEQRRCIEVVNFDKWLADFLRRNGVGKSIAYPSNPRYERCWQKAMTTADIGLPEAFYAEEWRRIILPQEITEEKEYLRASRVGRGRSLGRNQRKNIWPVFETMRSAMVDAGLMTIEDACHMAEHILQKQSGVTHYRGVIVDEAQDFSDEALKVLARLSFEEGDPEKARIFLAGDGQQRIYARRGSLASCGINVRGRRSRRLRLVYRTTEEIRRASMKILGDVAFDDMDEGTEEQKGASARRHGCAPVVHAAASRQAECDWIFEQIRSLTEATESTIEPRDICVVAATNTALETYRTHLESRGMPTVMIKRKEADTHDVSGVRFATMHRVKGLEFKAVFIAGADDGRMPAETPPFDDEAEGRLNETTQRSLFYVAATRARDVLFVSCAGNPGEFMKLLASTKP